MPPPKLREMMNKDTPEGVDVPQSWPAFAVWAVTRFGIGIIVLALLGVLSLLMVAVTSCSSAPSPTEARAATIQLTERDLRDAGGRFVTPVHAVTGEPASTQQTLYRTASGAEMHGPVYRLRSTEIPQLTGH